MKSARSSLVCTSLLALVAAAFPTACGSDGQGDSSLTGVASGAGGSRGGAAGTSAQAGAAGRGGGGPGGSSGSSGASAGGSSGICTSDDDCVLAGKATTPPGCAVGTCVAGACKYAAIDADGDGFATDTCKATGTTVIALGDDCDDTNAKVSPKGWDGPADGTKADACDGVDQDCSGKADDDKTAAGATCTCVPGDVQACDTDDDGKPIVFPTGKPLGECRRGARTCLESGAFGPCTGAVGPAKEECNDKDDDCDGNVDLAGDKPPSDATFWLYDQDDDLHAAKMAEPVKSCNAPTKGPCGDEAACPAVNATTGKTHWREGLPKDDCLDTDGGVFPGATEVCNGKDDDCNEATKDESATGVATWFWDGDGDGFVADGEIAGAIKSCANPGLLVANCRGGTGTCEGKWLLDAARKAGSDCDDADAGTFPGAWDGPAPRRFGLDPKGLVGKVYKTPAGSSQLKPEGLVFPRTDEAGAFSPRTLEFPWGRGGPLPDVTNYFSVEASGTIVAPESGTYTFTVERMDDYLDLRIGSETLQKGCCVGPGIGSNVTLSVAMNADVPLPIRVQMHEGPGMSGLRIVWEGPGVARQVVSVRDEAALLGRPDRCDTIRQNCSASEADLGAEGAYRCGGACLPGRERLCGVDWSLDKPSSPKSPCRMGRQVCDQRGKWGVCEGAVLPVAEVCANDVDDDCNGSVDETTGTFYQDLDGDTHGNPGVTKSGCDLGTQWVATGDDCDDRPGIGAAAYQVETWYYDEDRDGSRRVAAFFGDSTQQSCGSPNANDPSWSRNDNPTNDCDDKAGSSQIGDVWGEPCSGPPLTAGFDAIPGTRQQNCSCNAKARQTKNRIQCGPNLGGTSRDTYFGPCPGGYAPTDAYFKPDSIQSGGNITFSPLPDGRWVLHQGTGSGVTSIVDAYFECTQQ